MVAPVLVPAVRDANQVVPVDQRQVVAGVASTLFGTTVRPEHVIGETLVRATGEAPGTVPAERLTSPAPRAYDDLARDPLARWIEDRFGLVEDETAGRLVRRPPTQIEVAARESAPAYAEGRLWGFIRHARISEAQKEAFWHRMVALVEEFDALPREGDLVHGFAIGVYPVEGYPQLPRPTSSTGP